MPRFIETAFRPLGNWKHFEQIQWLLFVVFYTMFANVPFWAASHWLRLLPLGWVCLEYAGVGLLALFVPRIVATALLILLIVADLTSAVSKTYYLPPSECLASMGALREFSGVRLLVTGAVAVLVLLVASISAFFPLTAIRSFYRTRAALCLVVFVVLGVTIDYVSIARETGHAASPFHMARPVDANKFSSYKNLWISRYTLLRLVRNEGLFGAKRNAIGSTRADGSPIPSATAMAISSLGLGTGKSTMETPNLVVILVESWGLESDASIRNALVRPYAQPGLHTRYEVSQGIVPFHGGTVAGEARELCGNNMGLEIMNASAQQLQDCLPDRLASLGYRNLALHGMSGYVFSRSIWHGLIGFQEQWFRDQFRQEGLPDCAGAFNGTCDASIAEWIGKRLGTKEQHPDFVYWITLNSHLPVPIPSGLQAGASSCSLSPTLSEQPALCSWYQLVFNVHESVSKLAMGKLTRPTVFVIVGDHAPPFASATRRALFSDTFVPYVLLVPRRKGGTADLDEN
jgi:hypothetical protein